ncbi:atlastin-3-like isoform X2 [Crassostrea virginica]
MAGCSGDASKRKNPYDQPEEPTNKRSRGLFAQQEFDSSHSGYTTNRPSSADKGEPLRVFNLVSKIVDGKVVHQLELNENNLKKILLHPEVKDRPVAIVSVAGALRKGKSFLLGFLLKYLQAHERPTGGDWLTDDDVIDGFEWRGGRHGVTTGILIWSKPFIRVNKYGEKVAVLLMDTQGAFDSSMTVKDCASIFALSNLISSVQVYNIMQQIQENDLQHLELFAEYGRMVTEMSEHPNAKQSRLIFLIRDWAYPSDYQYGEMGGNAYLREIMQSEESQHQELKRLRRNITSCFPNFDGFLLPYPGKAVALQQSNCVLVKEMDFNFIKYIKDFMPYVMAKDKLVPKTIDNKDVIGKDMLEFVKVLVDAMQNETIPTPQTAFEATVEFGRRMALNAAFDFYEKEMDEICSAYEQRILPEEELEKMHFRIKAQAEEQFSKNPRMKIKERERQSLKTLEEQIIKKYTEKRSQIRDRNKNLEREIADSRLKMYAFVAFLGVLAFKLIL